MHDFKVAEDAEIRKFKLPSPAGFLKPAPGERFFHIGGGFQPFAQILNENDRIGLLCRKTGR